MTVIREPAGIFPTPRRCLFEPSTLVPVRTIIAPVRSPAVLATAVACLPHFGLQDLVFFPNRFGLEGGEPQPDAFLFDVACFAADVAGIRQDGHAEISAVTGIVAALPTAAALSVCRTGIRGVLVYGLAVGTDVLVAHGG